MQVSNERVIARRIVVHGRVQGVFFRANTRDQARQAGVHGWVRNRADGAVEAWLEGPDSAVQRVLSWVEGGGPSRAHVDDVEVVEELPGGHRRFAVRPDEA